jgi:ABC-type phosphate transport system substrate-binding protein
MALIYEGRTKNWQVLGGEDRPIKFYNPEQGKGLWEPFVTWVYGDLRKAGLGSAFETVASGEEARNSVEFNGGSISVAPIGLVDSKAIFALALKDDTGKVIAPEMESIVKQRYPLSRPIVAIAGQRPTGNLRKMLDYLQTPEAHEILKQHGLVPAPPDAPLAP